MPRKKVFFSVILPTYNRAHSVCVAIESLLRQTFRDFELVVADDGSTDGTAALLKRRYAREIADNRIRLLELTHGGVCSARNGALAEAAGTWIAYLDSDNVVSPEFLQTFADGIASHPMARNFYAALVRRRLGTVLDEPFSRAVLLKWNYIDMGVYCHHRDLIVEFGGFDTSVPGVEDWDLIIRHSEKYEPIRLGRIVENYSDMRNGDRLTFCRSRPKSVRRVRRKLVPVDARDVNEWERELVKASSFFDGQWYASVYGEMLDGMEPVEHYLSVGWLLGCDPGPFFTGIGYLKCNRDVAVMDVCPLLHYERQGRAEGRVGFLRREPLKYSGVRK